MTLLNVHVGEKIALIATDTECEHGDGTFTAVTKLFPLPHLRAIVTGRGQMPFLTAALGAVNFATEDFDGVADALAGWLADALKLLRPILAKYAPGQEIVLVGWSPTAGRMVGFYYANEDDGPTFERSQIHRQLLTPHFDELNGQDRNISTIPLIKSVAESQHRLLRDRIPDAALGGELIVAQLTEASVAIGSVHRFPPR